jgi:hypothetical protein
MDTHLILRSPSALAIFLWILVRKPDLVYPSANPCNIFLQIVVNCYIISPPRSPRNKQCHILLFRSYHAQRTHLQAESTSNLYNFLLEIHHLNCSPSFGDYQHMVTFVWHPMVLRQRDALCGHRYESILSEHSGDSCVFNSECLLLCVLNALSRLRRPC